LRALICSPPLVPPSAAQSYGHRCAARQSRHSNGSTIAAWRRHTLRRRSAASSARAPAAALHRCGLACGCSYPALSPCSIRLAIGAGRRTVRGLRAARLRTIKEDVVANLGAGDLSVEATARRHRMSTRHLHRLFESEGVTYSEFVLARRLACAYRMLTDPQHAAWTVKAITFEAGFANRNYFNRVFCARYGLSPSDVRELARRGQEK